MRSVKLSRRFLTGAWFSIFGLLGSVLLMFHRPIASNAVILFMCLPAVSAGISGCIWGGSLLEPAKPWSETVLRSLGITFGGYLIYAALFGCSLPLLENGWSIRQGGGLFLFALTFGSLMAGPLMLLVGIAAGLTLRTIWGGHFKFSARRL